MAKTGFSLAKAIGLDIIVLGSHGQKWLNAIIISGATQ
jgi:hypothetical protein